MTPSAISLVVFYLCESMILLIYGLFAQFLRYAQKIILGISSIYLWLFFSHALILNENPHKSTESSTAIVNSDKRLSNSRLNFSETT